ncbi:MAG: TRAP transporter small permease subunit [Porticoccaceae bacterium]|jgi:TRAP-type mannitol/chloroaromatic compound transport system permease small subunit|tara:strand:- start:458 stop:1039 length:582 start_codon:yes stop_codon:yes gene_type:complete
MPNNPEILSLLKPVVIVLNVVESFTETTGRLIAWLTMLMVVLVMIVVVTRYFLEVGSIALQESVTYLHCLVFMLGLAFTLKHDGHVRVDIFYRGFSPKSKAVVNLLGGILFLVPVCLLIFFTSWNYVLASWAIQETSAENNGLPFVYLLKTLMLLMPATLLLQGIAEIIKSGLVVSGADISETPMATNNEPVI